MNILLIHQYFLEKKDGGGSRFNELTKIWSNSGHHVTVLAGMIHYNSNQKIDKYKSKYMYLDNNFYQNVDVIRCHASGSQNLNFVGRFLSYLSFVISSTLAGIIKANKKKYDLILVSSPPLFVGITALILSFLKRVPIVFEVRDLWPESAIDTGVLKNKLLIKLSFLFEKFIYKKSRLINVLTPAFRDHLIKNKFINHSKIIFIPNAADFSLSDKLLKNFDFIKFKESLGFKNKFVLTYVGAHGLANNLFQLVEAAETLKDKNIIIQLIGDGMQKKDLIHMVNEKKLNNVVFRDPIAKKDIFKYILSSDVGVSILKKAKAFETIYSNKTFDYMSCKRPILMGISGVSKDLILESKSGIYVEPENIDSIADGILKLSKMSNDELSLMGNNGYLYAKKNFNRDILSKDYINFLSRINDRK